MSSPASDHLRSGISAQEKGDLESARRLFLQAAHTLMREAKQERRAAQRRVRTEQARQIMARADQLGTVIEQRRAAGTPTALVESVNESTPNWLLAERPNVRLDDVAGLDDVKQQVHLKLIYPFTHPETAERYGVRPGGGILLYGPPGTGKTYIARAIAGELNAAFFVAKASNLMSQWFGKAEQNIAALFEAARKHERAVIFLDEIEALIPKRGSTGSSVMPRVISEFLAQTQSLGDQQSGALMLLGASNEPWSIDPAALRPGRFDELIYVGLPDFETRLHLLEMNLRDRPLATDIDLSALALLLDGYSGADVAYVCTRVGQVVFLEAVETGIEREIGQADFAVVLGERRSSVTPDMIKKYERFNNERRI